MKTVFNSNLQLAKVWASQTQYNGRGPSMFFKGQTLYSYGEHYELANIIEGPNGHKIVFINDNFYSMTTRKHLSIALKSIPENAYYFLVPFEIRYFRDIQRNDFFDITNIENTVKRLKDKVASTLKKQSRAIKSTFHFDDALRQIDQINLICNLFNLQYVDREAILYYKEAKDRINKINCNKIDKSASLINGLYDYFG